MRFPPAACSSRILFLFARTQDACKSEITYCMISSCCFVMGLSALQIVSTFQSKVNVRHRLVAIFEDCKRLLSLKFQLILPLKLIQHSGLPYLTFSKRCFEGDIFGRAIWQNVRLNWRTISAFSLLSGALHVLNILFHKICPSYLEFPLIWLPLKQSRLYKHAAIR